MMGINPENCAGWNHYSTDEIFGDACAITQVIAGFVMWLLLFYGFPVCFVNDFN